MFFTKAMITKKNAQSINSFGAVIAMAGFLWGTVEAVIQHHWLAIIYELVGAFIAFVMLIQTGLIKHRRYKLPYNWGWILVLILIHVIILIYSMKMQLSIIGVIVEFIGLLLLLIYRM